MLTLFTTEITEATENRDGIAIDKLVPVNRRELLLGVAAGFSLPVKAIAQAITPLDITKNVCTLTCAQTLGPCYYAANLIRQDITEGEVGLPTLISFLVVDADTCVPIENAAIDIWHTNAKGVYSAPINQMCNPGDALARTKTFTRGIQMTDPRGWAHFNTVFPGWYSGRTTHIHATVRRNGSEMVTTQFYFDDSLTNFIYKNHVNYLSRPNRDTTNSSDNVIGGAASRVAPFLFTTKLINDRSLVALKVIAIRSSRTTCNA
ncbi:MAG: protocatechuate 3,4-dioxygenase [Acidobacteria bacterium]|nr:MAG: protocatechuate 3,4-dioxygenase [Acidobacteriota bacterium]